MRNYIELVEAMTYGLLREERGRIEYLVKTYGAKLEAKWNTSNEPSEVQAAIEQTEGESLPIKLIGYIATFDPSHNGQFTQWLVLRYLKNRLRLEDLEAATEYLSTYQQLKNQRQLPANLNDINAIPSLADLAKVIGKTHADVISGDEQEEQAMLQQAEILYDGADCRIIQPHTQAAACYFGRNTEWCTAWGRHTDLGLKHQGRHPTRSNRYDYYTKQGPLFIIEIKTTPPQIYQYHVETRQFMDVSDTDLSDAQVRTLLKTYPVIMKVIGEARFAQTHLRALGFDQFSPAGLAVIPAQDVVDYVLAGSIDRQKAYESLPEVVQDRPDVTAQLLKAALGRIIPPEKFTPEVAAVLGEITQSLPSGSPVWKSFEYFPINQWSQEAVKAATEQGWLTYEQFMAQPESQRSPIQLKQLIITTAAMHPENIADYPIGLIGQLEVGYNIAERTPMVLQYLSPADLPDNELIRLAKNGLFNRLETLAYVPPERLTEPLLAAVKEKAQPWEQDEIASVAAIEPILRNKCIRLVVSLPAQKFNDGVAPNKPDPLGTLPRRYLDDPTFLDALFDQRAQLVQGNAKAERNTWMAAFANYAEQRHRLTSHIVESYVKNLVVSWRDDDSASIAVIRTIRNFLLNIDKTLWTPEVIKSGLVRKFIKPDEVPDALITPDVAARIFMIDPKDTTMVYRADDTSLINEIVKQGHYAVNPMIAAIPSDRITEPVAFAMVSKGGVKDAKKRFPKAALSKRVYMAGVPWSFDLNQVPKSVRNDALMVKAVQVNVDQIKFVPDAVTWLNAHRSDFAKQDVNWRHGIEKYGIVATATGFETITDLPHHAFDGGFTLFKAILPKSVARWFLRKGDTTVAVLLIANRKLRFETHTSEKSLEPVLREIANKYLANVDITVLNKIGIYRNRDGSIREPEEKLPSKTIEGIDWTTSPHLKGKLFTAWKNDKELLTVYYAAAGGWGWQTKIQRVKLVDQKAAFANAAALIPGIKDISHNPGNGRHAFLGIGIGWSESQGYWLVTEHKVGDIKGYDVYYNSGQRFISIYLSGKGLVGRATLLKNGKLKGDEVYEWLLKDEADAPLLKQTLTAMADKMSAKHAAQ